MYKRTYSVKYDMMSPNVSINQDEQKQVGFQKI